MDFYRLFLVRLFFLMKNAYIEALEQRKTENKDEREKERREKERRATKGKEGKERERERGREYQNGGRE